MTQPAIPLPTPAPTLPAVKIRATGLRKAFPQTGRGARKAPPVEVLRDFDLDIREGEFLALLGPSGCGKSTFLNILAGLEHYDGGALTLDGAPVTGVNRNVGVVFQSYALFPWLSVQKNVEVGLKVRGVAAAERRRIAERILTTVGLEQFANLLPHRLSGGMRQRVAIARSLAYNPRCWCSTSRSQRSTPRPARSCSTSCCGSGRPAPAGRPSCSSPTPSTRRSSWPTGSR